MKKNGEKKLFYDLGTSKSRKKHKTNKYVSFNKILSDSSIKGTKVYSNSSNEGFYYINQELDKKKNYEFSFRWVDGYFITPIIQIREVSDMDALITFQKQSSDEWQIFSKDNNLDKIDFNGIKSFVKQPIYKNDKIKLVKIDNQVKVYCANKLVIRYAVNFQSNFYIGFGGHSYGDRFTIFKELELKEIY